MNFYFELFGQRQSQFADWLVSCDRIALDCYQHTFLGLGIAKSIPAPPPYSYMRTGFSPATFRRGIPLRRLGKQLNPRSEEHTSELQSLRHLVCRLLLEK